jgi:KUP system potassium uptake protein
MSSPAANHGVKQPMGLLMLGAIGVVFGDIGTSPLYTMKTLFTGRFGVPLTHDNVLGLLSVIFWSLILVVTLKYAALVMRADNRGEGGVLALTALVSARLTRESRLRWWLAGLGIFGAAMFFGDAMITPAVSVLGALEGIEVMTPMFVPYVVPLAIVIAALFAIRARDRVGQRISVRSRPCGS